MVVGGFFLFVVCLFLIICFDILLIGLDIFKFIFSILDNYFMFFYNVLVIYNNFFRWIFKIFIINRIILVLYWLRLLIV